MAKLKLEFDFHEEREEWQDAVNAVSYKLVIEYVLNHIRAKTKHIDNPPEIEAIYDEIRDVIWQAKQEHGVEFT